MGVAMVVFAMLGTDLRAEGSVPATVVTVATVDKGAADRQEAVPEPAPDFLTVPAPLAMPETSWSGQGAALRTPALESPRNPVAAFQAPRGGNDLRVFLLNMARSEWDHSSLGIHGESTGMAWIDDPMKSDR
jgi:hypothetical protein